MFGLIFLSSLEIKSQKLGILNLELLIELFLHFFGLKEVFKITFCVFQIPPNNKKYKIKSYLKQVNSNILFYEF